MPRMTASKGLELESFWWAHLDGWRRSELNQREYCELHGLPLKRFGNWRAKFKHEDPAPTGIRPVALGRKNHLFAGSDGGADRWAAVASLLATAKLNGVEPYAYLKDALDRMTRGHPINRIDELLPWNWTPNPLGS